MRERAGILGKLRRAQPRTSPMRFTARLPWSAENSWSRIDRQALPSATAGTSRGR